MHLFLVKFREISNWLLTQSCINGKTSETNLFEIVWKSNGSLRSAVKFHFDSKYFKMNFFENRSCRNEIIKKILLDDLTVEKAPTRLCSGIREDGDPPRSPLLLFTLRLDDWKKTLQASGIRCRSHAECFRRKERPGIVIGITIDPNVGFPPSLRSWPAWNISTENLSVAVNGRNRFFIPVHVLFA